MTAPLATHVSGSGPDLVLVHGWGMHAGVWDGVVPALSRAHRVTRIDLPGHGASPGDTDFDLPRLRGWLAEAVPAPAVWVGWSLGGLVALDLALHRPDRVRGLVLVAAPTRFLQAPDWPDAVAPEVLDQFAAGLVDDYRGTMLRFLALQTRGAADGREALRRLRDSWAAAPAPRPRALRSGLALLRDTDLRAALPRIACPVLVLAGERDTLVPASAAVACVEAMPGARLEIMAGAGHAPFLSDSDGFVRHLADFSAELSRIDGAALGPGGAR
jgi:pimeloyl-[acyl-carrier protein] methyl ester esterase